MNILESYNEIDKDEAKEEFIRSLEFQGVNDKWELFSEILKDYEEYDLARIAVLKILEIAEIPKINKDAFSGIIINIINEDEDYDVRNYAVLACSNFMEYISAVSMCEKIVLDINEDVDVRYNAFAAMLRNQDKERRRKILQQLQNDVEFNKSASRYLTELN